MNQQTEDKKFSISNGSKVAILVVAIIFFVFSAFNIYTEIRRQNLCSQMASYNAQVAPVDVDSYILRKEAFENVCLDRTGFGSYLFGFFSLWFLGYAVTLFSKDQDKAHKPLTTITKI